MVSDNGRKKYPHLWIPQEEVLRLNNERQGRNKDYGLDPFEHGTNLSQSLETITQAYSRLEDKSLVDDDFFLFKLILPKGEDIHARRKEITETEGLEIKVVKDKRNAIVSAEKPMFQRLQKRIETYKNTGNLKHFQYFEDFKPYSIEEKQASSLKQYILGQKDTLSIDVQMMFMPNLSDISQNKALDRVAKKVQQFEGKLQAEPYRLSDNTAVIRALIPIKTLRTIAEDPFIYRVERTGFFMLSPSSIEVFDRELNLSLKVDIDSLPTVAVLDDGVDFPEDFSRLVPVHWSAKGCSKNSAKSHGTAVASKVIFSHIGDYVKSKDFTLVPRAKVIDCNIYDDKSQATSDVLIQRITEAVQKFSSECSIFNFSSNSEEAIEGDELSIMAYELDALTKRYGVKFVVPTGNHRLAHKNRSLKEILDDDDARIAPPADAMLAITVGAIAGSAHRETLSKANEVTAYSRIGPGFAGFYKPDLVAQGANLKYNLEVPRDQFSTVMAPGGKLTHRSGTSFTAPIVSGDLAELLSIVPDNEILLAQALLYNGALPFWDESKITQEEAETLRNYFGRGLSSSQNSQYSSPHKVTFLRSGSLQRSIKERVKFFMPSLQAEVKGNSTTKVTVTCLTDPSIDRTKGEQYLGSYISASLHKLGRNGNLGIGNPGISTNRIRWDSCCHFSNVFSQFSGGDWQVWLELSTRWFIDEKEEIPYALVVTIEDLKKTNDLYSLIMNEAGDRFQPITSSRVLVR